MSKIRGHSPLCPVDPVNPAPRSLNAFFLGSISLTCCYVILSKRPFWTIRIIRFQAVFCLDLALAVPCYKLHSDMKNSFRVMALNDPAAGTWT